MRRVIYINVPWMKRYLGAIKGVDEPRGTFRYTLEHPMNDHCQFNFKTFAGKVYGHVPGRTNPDLKKLGASGSDKSINGITVVWIATDPDSGGRVIVGWFKNATVWKMRQTPSGELAKQRTIQNSGDCCKFSIEAANEDAMCLLPGKRPSLNIGTGRPGQNPFWYGSHAADMQVLRAIKDGRGLRASRQQSGKNVRGGWIQDQAQRLKIERNAMERVAQCFNDNGYDVQDKSHENLGYDMLAVSEAAKLQLEVKGNKGNRVCVELTPNEFSCAKKNSKTFRLCVVLDALNEKLDKRKLRIFRPFAKRIEWQDEDGICIRTIPKTGAVIRE